MTESVIKNEERFMGNVSTEGADQPTLLCLEFLLSIYTRGQRGPCVTYLITGQV